MWHSSAFYYISQRNLRRTRTLHSFPPLRDDAFFASLEGDFGRKCSNCRRSQKKITELWNRETPGRILLSVTKWWENTFGAILEMYQRFFLILRGTTPSNVDVCHKQSSANPRRFLLLLFASINATFAVVFLTVFLGIALLVSSLARNFVWLFNVTLKDTIVLCNRHVKPSFHRIKETHFPFSSRLYFHIVFTSSYWAPFKT